MRPSRPRRRNRDVPSRLPLWRAVRTRWHVVLLLLGQAEGKAMSESKQLTVYVVVVRGSVAAVCSTPRKAKEWVDASPLKHECKIEVWGVR